MGHGKVAIIGAGSLGSTVAYSLILRRMVAEILLVDINTDILQGQILDLSGAALGTDTIVRAGTFKEAGQADIILITADVVKHDESQLQWTKRSRQLLDSITHALLPIQPRAILIVGVDPVDILTRHLQTTVDLPIKQIFGAGSSAMNTARARHWVAQMSEAATDSSVQLYVIGTRDVPVIGWYSALVDGLSVNAIPQLTFHRPLLERIIAADRITEIKEYKGGAWYGHSAFLVRVIRAVMSKDATIHVLSTYIERFDTCISMPVILTQDGVRQEVPVPLSSEEQGLLTTAVHQAKKDFDETVIS